jgi:riboflavin synthase
MLLATPSQAEDISRTPVPPMFYQAVIEPLIPEVTAITRLPVPPDMPNVYMASRQSIEQAYCGNAKHDCHVAAITDDKTADIVISPALLQVNLFTASVIFHELVHWAQVKNHMFTDEADCAHWAKSEMHAYTAQSRFLESHGGRGFAVPDLLAQCR